MWHLLVGVWDRTGTNSYLYIDAIERSSDGGVNQDLNATNTRFTIGSGTRVADSFLDASIGKPSLCNLPLSAQEIADIFEDERTLFGV